MTNKRVGYYPELTSQFPEPNRIRSITLDTNGNILNVEYWPPIDLNEILDNAYANSYGDPKST